MLVSKRGRLSVSGHHWKSWLQTYWRP
jgi:hypothetical protein